VIVNAKDLTPKTCAKVSLLMRWLLAVGPGLRPDDREAAGRTGEGFFASGGEPDGEEVGGRGMLWAVLRVWEISRGRMKKERADASASAYCIDLSMVCLEFGLELGSVSNSLYLHFIRFW